MRRKDREITDIDKIETIIASARSILCGLEQLQRMHFLWRVWDDTNCNCGR